MRLQTPFSNKFLCMLILFPNTRHTLRPMILRDRLHLVSRQYTVWASRSRIEAYVVEQACTSSKLLQKSYHLLSILKISILTIILTAIRTPSSLSISMSSIYSHKQQGQIDFSTIDRTLQSVSIGTENMEIPGRARFAIFSRKASFLSISHYTTVSV